MAFGQQVAQQRRHREEHRRRLPGDDAGSAAGRRPGGIEHHGGAHSQPGEQAVGQGIDEEQARTGIQPVGGRDAQPLLGHPVHRQREAVRVPHHLGRAAGARRKRPQGVLLRPGGMGQPRSGRTDQGQPAMRVQHPRAQARGHGRTGVQQQAARLHLPGHRLPLCGRLPRVGHHGDRAGPHRPQQRDRGLRAVGQADQHPVADRHAQRGPGGGRTCHLDAQGAVSPALCALDQRRLLRGALAQQQLGRIEGMLGHGAPRARA